ncbi:MAG: glutathione S-transferase family protein, partial [Myxococcales bacterium]|nr:glutathione S-transferase family protein [Myxococcales bacterium]
MPIRILGTPVSPYVRKVLVVLERKGIPYEVEPIIPFLGDETFTRRSPLRRIPVLLDGDVTVPDSSVICQYLEERFPTPSILPADLALRARARWWEEYADTKLGEVFIFHYFVPKIVRPGVLGEPRDEALIARNLETALPEALDFLETQVPGESGYLCGDFSLADISVASFFRNGFFAGFRLDAARRP